MDLKHMQLLKPEHTLDMILEALEDLVQYELAVVLTYDGSDTLAVSKVKGELYTPELEDYRISLKEREDLARIISRQRTYLFGEDEQHLDTYYDVLEMPDHHSCLVSPLFVQDELVGLMTLDHRICGVYSEKIVRFIETLSKLIAVNLAQSSASRALNARNQELLRERNHLLKHSSRELKDLIGTSPAWVQVLDNIRLVAGTPAPVLIQGETGTGKEMAARAIHRLSSRASGPFAAVNCSTLTPSLAESELFGHERGAFTGAHALRKGRFEIADGGTLFLDEIGDLPMEIQPKLLRVIQEGYFERVGGEQSVSVDVRIIAASHVDLAEAVEKRSFREDLYYRISVFPIHLPALRDRGDDTLLLAETFLQEIRGRRGYGNVRFSDTALEMLRRRSWPGNVRELKNAVERSALLSRGGMIRPEHICRDSRQTASSVACCSEELTDLDSAVRNHIRQVLVHTKGRIYGDEGAAKILQVKPSTLQSRMKRLGISPEAFR